jgi:hypothetical protein
MNVNVKTIRSWLKSLEKAEFIYSQGNAWDRGCNYPKKKYIFPVTFPGFDSATVFIQKGAKAKYKKRMADPVKSKAKVKKAARLARKNTCPVASELIDCPSFINERETQNSKEDTKVSSSEILVNCPASAQPTPASCKSIEAKHVLDYAPELKDLLIAYLREHGHRGKIQWVSNFIEQEIRANKTFRFNSGLNGYSPDEQHLIHDVDRLGLARSLEYVIPLLMANRAPSKRRLTLLFRFLREYIAEYCADSYWRSPEFNQFRYEALWKEYKERKRFFREFPFCEPPDVFDPITTGVNW